MDQGLGEFRYLIRKLGKDTLTYIPAKLVPGAIAILSVAIFTRIFPPGDYGKYILVLTTTTILSAIFSQWVLQSTLRYRAQYVARGKENVFNKSFFLVLAILSISVFTLGLLLYPFRKTLGSYDRFYLLSISIIITQIWFDNVTAVFQADLKSFIFSFYTILNAIFKFGIAIFLIYFWFKSISALLWGILFANLCFLIPLVMHLQRSPHRAGVIAESPSADLVADKFFSFSKQFFSYGFPMVGWFLGAQLLNLSDRYFLQIFRSSTEVGIYSSNYNLAASAISFVSMPLLTAAHPLLMKLGASIATKQKEAQKLIKAFSRYFLIIAFPAVTYALVFSKDLADIFLGIDYRQGNSVLPIILFGLLGWYFAMIGHKGLEFREKTNIMFIYVMICAAVKAILNILIIPRYGYMGAAISTLVCFYMYPVLVYFGTKSDIGWNIPWLSLIRILIASIVLAISFVVVKTLHFSSTISLMIGGIIVIPIYLILLYFLNEFKPDEIEYMKNYLRNNVMQKRIF